MRRGEVWWVDFDPSVGGEVRKRSPAVIGSKNSANRFSEPGVGGPAEQ